MDMAYVRENPPQNSLINLKRFSTSLFKVPEILGDFKGSKDLVSYGISIFLDLRKAMMLRKSI